ELKPPIVFIMALISGSETILCMSSNLSLTLPAKCPTFFLTDSPTFTLNPINSNSRIPLFNRRGHEDATGDEVETIPIQSPFCKLFGFIVLQTPFKLNNRKPLSNLLNYNHN